MNNDLKIPENYQAVMPYLIVKDASKFITFVTEIFGARELQKVMRDEHTIMHAEVMINDTNTIMLADVTDNYEPQTVGLFIYVDDADETFKNALNAGATVVNAMSDQPYGRSGGVMDPCGNTWWITSVK
jgi:PhnB protein